MIPLLPISPLCIWAKLATFILVNTGKHDEVMPGFLRSPQCGIRLLTFSSDIPACCGAACKQKLIKIDKFIWPVRHSFLSEKKPSVVVPGQFSSCKGRETAVTSQGARFQWSTASHNRHKTEARPVERAHEGPRGPRVK